MDILSFLVNHSEPAIRWKTVMNILDRDSASCNEVQQVKAELSSSPLIMALLSDRNSEGKIPYNAYDKWFGAHWVLYLLADLGYPKGDQALKPLLDQCYGWLLSKDHERAIHSINGRVRRCASQEGNCIYYSLALGLADGRTEELVHRLLKWQWDDGGWNCDKKPDATVSSFNESLIPLRGLVLFAKSTGDPKVEKAINRSADIFLKRYLFKRIRDGKVINRNFVVLHYPCYWHYDILFSLKVMADAGFINDPRCTEAIDLLESKRLPDGGYPAEERYYRVDEKKLSGHSRVNWGGTSKVYSNPFVTIDALTVLKKSGRIII